MSPTFKRSLASIAFLTLMGASAVQAKTAWINWVISPSPAIGGVTTLQPTDDFSLMGAHFAVSPRNPPTQDTVHIEQYFSTPYSKGYFDVTTRHPSSGTDMQLNLTPLYLPDGVYYVQLETPGYGLSNRIKFQITSPRNYPAQISATSHPAITGQDFTVSGLGIPDYCYMSFVPVNNPYLPTQKVGDVSSRFGLYAFTKLPDTLCDGDYLVSLVSGDGKVQTNSLPVTVVSAKSPGYVTYVQGYHCVKKMSTFGGDDTYFLGLAYNSRYNSKTWGTQVEEGVTAGNNIWDSVDLVTAMDKDGVETVDLHPASTIYLVGLGQSNNYYWDFFYGRTWDYSKYHLNGNNVYQNTWGTFKMDKFETQIDIDSYLNDNNSPSMKAIQLQIDEEYAITHTGGDDVIGVQQLKWTPQDVEKARQMNGYHDVMKIVDMYGHGSHYQLECHLIRVYPGSAYKTWY
ncbi:hypothetical protein CCAX7_21640 [Capsulimonas corticalis]|uniref:Uncharacterized protein n=1 Tax=Capsulimonas corticalis TaxID=2219043 RepID=A0A402D244_9BACT|nr:hypothetical protein [Capsulimonas corticalis]BDI30113.1 hypothetical protein CCAX7_21640 [Capsulimonas corticalis]